MSRKTAAAVLLRLCVGTLLTACCPGVIAGSALADQKPQGQPPATGIRGLDDAPTPANSISDNSPVTNRMLHQQGTHIIDEHGSEVKLRGVNLGGWLVWEGWIFGKGIITSQARMTIRLERAVGAEQTAQFRTQVYDNFITESDIQAIARLGFNCVRVPFHYRLFDDDSGFRLLDQVVDWCERSHIYAILDLHMVPGSTLGMLEPRPIWKSDETRKKVAGIWKAIAARYHDRKTIAGYDLIGEPLPPSGKDLISVYQQIIQAIREVDREHLIILEGSKFASDFSMFDRPLDENQAYSFHMYNWFGDDRKKKLAEYLALARKQNTPLYVGEFGENTYEMIGSTVDLFARCPEIDGWTFWTWKKAPSAYPGLITIKLPKDWKTTMDWLGSLFESRQPGPDTIRAGMKEFIEAAALDHCVFDSRMEQALLGARSTQITR